MDIVTSKHGSLQALIRIGEFLTLNGKTLSIAESCTGGALSAEITKIPGCSSWFLGGVISYSNYIKTSMLMVPLSVISDFGAVSEETAFEMARGVAKKTDANYGIALTGVAGPGGGTRLKPVGTVYLSLATSNDLICSRKMFFGGDRVEVQHKAVDSAIDLMQSSLLVC